MHPATPGSVAETAEPLWANVAVTGPEQPPPPSISSQIALAVPAHVPARLMAGAAVGGVGVGLIGVGLIELPESQAATQSPSSATKALA